jgi:predicted small secreted protein
MKKLLAIGLVMALTACNTVQGVGKDVQVVGSSIERAAAKK